MAAPKQPSRPPDDRTLNDVLTPYVAYLQTLRPPHGMSPLTIRNYVGAIRAALRAGDMLAPVRGAQSSSARGIALGALKAWDGWKGTDFHVQAGKLPTPNYHREETMPVPTDEWTRIVSAARRQPEPNRGLLLILTTSGLRFHDIMLIPRATAQAIVRGVQFVYITQKSGGKRTWAPSQTVREALVGLLNLPNWNILCDLLADNEASAYKKLTAMLAAVCKEVGVEYARPHKFRHALACKLLDAGTDVNAIQATLGHRDSATTTRYYLHVSPERQRKAMSVIDDLFGENPAVTPPTNPQK